MPFLEENGSGRQARSFFWLGPLERTRPWRLWRRPDRDPFYDRLSREKWQRTGQAAVWLAFGRRELAAVFVIGFVLYMAAAAAVRTLSGGSEAYVADMTDTGKRTG